MARQWTPNQLAKREAIVAAATEVLRTEGVTACTARAIGGAGPLTKSALHYYFDDLDEVVDLAFRRLMDQFLDRIEKAAAGAADPVEALWAAAATYLRLGADRPATSRAPMLWFDYHVASARRGEMSTVNELTERAVALFKSLVRATGVAQPEARGATLFAALIGTVVGDASRRDAEGVLDELAVATSLPRSTPEADPSPQN